MKPRSYQLIGEGRNRAVFITPGNSFVIKVPINEDRYTDNFREYRMWQQIDRWIPREHLARCKLHRRSGILVMELVVPEYSSPENMPPWVDFIDCAQVGCNRS